MLRQLQSCIQKLKDTVEEEDIRCAILSSASTKVFSAGADLRERSTMTQIQASAFVSELRDTFQELASLPIPLIASIEGVAVGGGLELALTGDVLIAGANSTFGLPETSLGIIPGAGGTVRLPRKIGEARAKELIFTGKKINANTAYNYGLVEHVVEAGNADAQALE
jgi:methylglutaconyl-CoA hydratase